MMMASEEEGERAGLVVNTYTGIMHLPSHILASEVDEAVSTDGGFSACIMNRAGQCLCQGIVGKFSTSASVGTAIPPDRLVQLVQLNEQQRRRMAHLASRDSRLAECVAKRPPPPTPSTIPDPMPRVKLPRMVATSSLAKSVNAIDPDTEPF